MSQNRRSRPINASVVPELSSLLTRRVLDQVISTHDDARVRG
jgi:hypothetical protein